MNVYIFIKNKSKGYLALGVHISRDDLRWSVHTDIVRAKAAQVLGFAARNLRKCTQKVKRVSFLSLVKPILMYGLPAWHPTTQENMTKLERVQKRALRFIYGRQPPPPQETNIMPVEMHLKYTDLNFFKRCQGGAIDLTRALASQNVASCEAM
ncbi:Hypothetical predicted protein [Cloeon dipterum]|uniref:Uncharacterized protein n=1 Tax=Cloeon dipterum TaxID=197152 RepID=A0A8S1DRY2_9INSE|nr:Hypothetical predicted protein [Cloeon dipterum]